MAFSRLFITIIIPPDLLRYGIILLTVETELSVKNRYSKKYWVALAVSLVLFVAGCYLDAVATRYASTVATGPVLADLGFKLLRFNPVYPDVADLVLFVADIGFAVYVLAKKSYKNIPLYLACMGMFQLFRAAILPLTPLPTPIESANFCLFGNLLVTGGTFPSGHAGQLFMLFFLVSWKDRKTKYGMLVLALFESIVMIAARGHYTIDVVASFFIVFFIYTVMNGYWKKSMSIRGS